MSPFLCLFELGYQNFYWNIRVGLCYHLCSSWFNWHAAINFIAFESCLRIPCVMIESGCQIEKTELCSEVWIVRFVEQNVIGIWMSIFELCRYSS